MTSNEKLADQVLPKPGTSKIGEYEVQQKVGRPGTPQTWHLKNKGIWGPMLSWQTRYSPNLAPQKQGNMRSNKKLADQVLPKPGT